MAEAVRDYKQLATDIKNAVGESNIKGATHCATRLRLVLAETPSDETTKQIEQMPGVIQVVQAGGQYQVVIGMHAKDVYENLAGQMSFDQEVEVEGENKQSILNRVIAAMSGSIAPFVYILAGAGLLQGILIIIRMFADISGTGASQIYDMISWTPFTFLPVMIAVAASKHFKCNTYTAVWCSLALCNPTWASIAQTIAEGTPLDFFFVPLTSVTYTSTVIPPIIMVAVLSKLEKWVEPRIPDAVTALLTPVVCTAVMVPATIIVIGPISTIVANAIAAAYMAAYSVVPWIANGILAAIWMPLVVFGVHWSFTPIIMSELAEYGYTVIQPALAIAVCAMVATTFGVFFKSRNKKLKEVALSAGITGLFGITEPAIYGVALRLKKPFICSCIAAAAGAAVNALFGSRYFVFAGLPGILSTPNAVYTDAARAATEALGTASDAYASSLPGMLIGIAVAVVLAFVLVQVVGFDDPASDAAEAE
ncbi:MAG: PTS transporter subunit EIIC [Olegusella sp.]|nr:PTS transporter subunit EIIC [Olegusella sp.]